jgi:isocitrate dehydrogenase
MTKDLALAIHGRDMKREHWVITDVYMDKVKVRAFLWRLWRRTGPLMGV